MSDDLNDLYQELIVDHAMRPHNRREIPDTGHVAQGDNPTCGDRVKVYVRLSGDRLDDVSFTGAGCAVCMASASMMTDAVRDKSTSEADSLFNRFHDLVTGQAAQDTDDGLGELAALGGVRRFPIRVKCATLPWHALRAALGAADKPVSTE